MANYGRRLRHKSKEIFERKLTNKKKKKGNKEGSRLAFFIKKKNKTKKHVLPDILSVEARRTWLSQKNISNDVRTGDVVVAARRCGRNRFT
jgi:hypothetical protein